MSTLVITRESWHPSGGMNVQTVAQMELPDDPEVIAIIMEAAATAVQEYLNKDKQ